MQRGPLFLAAAFLEVLRFFFLMFFAEATGLLDSGALTPALLRYIASPQLLFVVAFFFLWMDRARYAAFRPLSLVGKVLSLVAFAPMMFSFFLSLRSEGFIPLPRTALLSALAIFAADLVTLFVLIFYRHTFSHRLFSRRVSAGPPASTTHLDPSSTPPPESEDIEQVEGFS